MSQAGEVLGKITGVRTHQQDIQTKDAGCNWAEFQLQCETLIIYLDLQGVSNGGPLVV